MFIVRSKTSLAKHIVRELSVGSRIPQNDSPPGTCKLNAKCDIGLNLNLEVKTQNNGMNNRGHQEHKSYPNLEDV